MGDVERRHPLLGPWWISAHVVVLAVLLTFPQLAMWQWSRYREEQATAAQITEGIERAPVPLADVLTPAVLADFDDADAEALEFTPGRGHRDLDR